MLKYHKYFLKTSVYTCHFIQECSEIDMDGQGFVIYQITLGPKLVTVLPQEILVNQKKSSLYQNDLLSCHFMTNLLNSFLM